MCCSLKWIIYLYTKHFACEWLCKRYMHLIMIRNITLTLNAADMLHVPRFLCIVLNLH